MSIARKIAVKKFIDDRFKLCERVETSTQIRFKTNCDYDYAIFWKKDNTITFRGFWGMIEKDYLDLSRKVDGKPDFKFPKFPF